MKQVLVAIMMASLFFISCSNKHERAPKQKVTTKIHETEMSKKIKEYVSVKLTTDVSKLTENQRKMLPILIKAADIMNGLFWVEAYGNKDSLLNSISDQDTKKFAEINYGPWDRLDGNKPFVKGIGEKPAGANYYPKDMTKEEYNNSKAKNLNDQY